MGSPGRGMTALEHDRPHRDDRPRNSRDLRFAGGLSLGLVSAILAAGALIAPMRDVGGDTRTAGEPASSQVRLPTAVSPTANVPKPGGPSLAAPIGPTAAPIGGATLPLSAAAPAPLGSADDGAAIGPGTSVGRNAGDRDGIGAGDALSSAYASDADTSREETDVTRSMPTDEWLRNNNINVLDLYADPDGDGVPTYHEWRLG